MISFEFISPSNIDDALELLARYGERAAVIAGGTDLTLELNERRTSPEVVINIKQLKELDYIHLEQSTFHIGALTTHTRLAESKELRSRVKVLQEAAAAVGSPQIRNMGTIGGNLAQTSVAGDVLAACTVLDAKVKLKSVRGERILSMEEFLTGGGEKRNAMSADELLIELFFTAPEPEHTATAFYKLAKRKSLAISVIAGCLSITVDSNGICTAAALSGGALARYPLRFTEAERYLIGRKPCIEVFEKTLPLLHDKVLEVNHARPWSVSYKKESVQGVFMKLYRDALEQLVMEDR